jgi:hypothetical protein
MNGTRRDGGGSDNKTRERSGLDVWQCRPSGE